MKFGKFFAILSAAGLMLFFTLDARADGWGISFNSHGYRGGYGWDMGYGGHGHHGHGRPSHHRHYYRPHVNIYRPYIYYNGNHIRAVEVVRDETVVVNIPNDNGSFTPVTLRRSNGTYVGPRGETYMTMPTTEQLKMAYGLK